VKGAEYDQLQPLSHARPFREGRLLPALSLVAWVQARPLRYWSCEVGCRSPYVIEKSTRYNHVPGEAGAHQTAWICTRRDVERQHLPGDVAGCRHGTLCHRGTERHPGRTCYLGTTCHPGTKNHRGTPCHQ